MTTTNASRGRIAVAVAGLVALVVTMVGHSVDTAAQATDTAKANSAFAARADFWPTPRAGATGCSIDWVRGLQRARISWAAPVQGPLQVPGGQYSYRLIAHESGNDANFVELATTSATSYQIPEGSALRGKSWYLRIYTVNGPKWSLDYQARGFHVNNVGPSIQTITCTETNEWNPHQGSRGGSRVLADGTAGYPNGGTSGLTQRAPQEALKAEKQATENATPETITVTSTAGAPAGASTAPAGESAPSGDPGAGTAPGESTSSSSPSPADPAPTTQAPTTVTTTAPTTTAVPTGSPWVLLPDGGRAEIVGTRLTISDADGQVCTTTVGEGAGLRRSGGVLTVTDADGSRTVDTETCALS